MQWEPAYEVAFRARTDGRVPDLAGVRAGLEVRPRQVAYAGDRRRTAARTSAVGMVGALAAPPAVPS